MPMDSQRWIPLDDTYSTLQPIVLTELMVTPASQRVSSIEVPGRIEGSGTGVLLALGGPRRVLESLENPNDVPLILRLAANDPYSKFIPARTAPAAGILLRVRRYRSGRKEVCVEGFVEQNFSYVALADYSLAPPDVCRYPRDVLSELETFKARGMADKNRRQPATDGGGASVEAAFDATRDFLVPPVYTKQFHSFSYKYQDNVFVSSAKYFLLEGTLDERKDHQDLFNLDTVIKFLNEKSNVSMEDDPGGVIATASPEQAPFLPLERGKSGPYNIVARFADPIVPIAGSAMVSPKVAPADLSLTAEVSDLFEKRPIWQRTSLMDNLSHHVTVWRLKPILARTCFLFLDGPWRGCLCKFGYDPRLDPVASIYQSLDFRDPFFRSVNWKTQQVLTTTMGDAPAVEDESTNPRNRPVRTAAGSQAFVPDWRFREPPSKPSQFYQLCDLDDAVIQELLRKAPRVDKCTKQTGWFTSDFISRIRDLLCAKSRMMRTQGEDVQ